MKRARNIRSTENVVVGSKDEPPKKIAKKRVKSVTAQSPTSKGRSSSDTLSSPVTSTPLVRPSPVSKLGSLPMYGEHLPEGGAHSIPKLADQTCSNLRDIMGKLKESKMKGGKVSYMLVELQIVCESQDFDAW